MAAISIKLSLWRVKNKSATSAERRAPWCRQKAICWPTAKTMRWKYSRYVPTKETPKQKVSNLYSGRWLWWKKLGPDSRETNLGDDSFSHFSDSLFGLSWMTCLSVGRVGWSQKFAFLLRKTTTRATNLMSQNINEVKEECALELDEAG